MKIGIFGGTFDPIHVGHLIEAQYIREIRNLDKIIFIPAYISPHKTEQLTSNAADRLNMLKLAIEDVPYFEYSDIEINKSVVSYTIDTLKVLIKKYDEIELIIGFDNIKKFDTWKAPDSILKLCKVIVIKREPGNEVHPRNKYMDMAVYANTPQIDISSTEIRERVSNNLPVNFLVPEKVNKYILENNLYKEK
ncbi:MAG: nicotinate-nucleotide adenylyltransferase [Bacteroidota bacterium]|nr:nicotinate-nucleotide adenylyltransferase [Bacteroidota bacterium]